MDYNNLADNLKSFAVSVGFAVIEDTNTAGLSSIVSGNKTMDIYTSENSYPVGSALVFTGSSGQTARWAQFRSQLDNARKLILQDGTKDRYFHLFFYDSTIVNAIGTNYTVIVECWTSTGYNASALSAVDHPGMIKGTACTNLPNNVPFQTKLFGGENKTGDKYLFLVCETYPQMYSHLGFGTIDKMFGFDGGEFVTGNATVSNYSTSSPAVTTAFSTEVYSMTGGSNSRIFGAPPGYLPGIVLRAALYQDYATTMPVDAWFATSTGYGTSTTVAEPINYALSSGFCKKLFCGSVSNGAIGGKGMFVTTAFPKNQFSGLNPLFTCWLACVNPSTSDTPPYVSLIGSLPGIRSIDISNLLSEDELNYGADVWKTFPLHYKASSAVDGVFGYSRNEGIAILK